jgi:hypothetical protein
MTKEKDRKEKRLVKNYMVHVCIEGFEGAALTSNISENGMLVLFHNEIPFAVDREVEILIAVKARMFSLNGRVKWKKELSDNFLVGMELVEPSDEFKEFWRTKIQS